MPAYETVRASLVAQQWNLPVVQRREFHLWVGKILWRREWQPIPVFLPEKQTEDPGGPQSPGSRKRVGHKWGTKQQHETVKDSDFSTNKATMKKCLKKNDNQ